MADVKNILIPVTTEEKEKLLETKKAVMKTKGLSKLKWADFLLLGGESLLRESQEE